MCLLSGASVFVIIYILPLSSNLLCACHYLVSIGPMYSLNCQIDYFFYCVWYQMLFQSGALLSIKFDPWIIHFIKHILLDKMTPKPQVTVIYSL